MSLVEDNLLYYDEEIHHMLHNNEDSLLPSPVDADHSQDTESDHQDEGVSPTLDYGYPTPQLSEEEAQTINKCVEILRNKKNIFAGEELLLQAQALLSEPQSLLSRSSSSSSLVSESTSYEQEYRLPLPACRKRK